MLGNPIARTDKLVVQKSGNEHLIYDLETNKAICMNQTSGLVWEHCDGKHSVSDISQELEKKLGSNVSEDLVLLAINQLANEGLLLAGGDLPNRFRGPTRREVIRKVGLTSMVALPVISAIVAPNVAHAQSCLGGGTPVPARPVTPTPTVMDCETYCNDPSAFTTCCSGMGNVGDIFNPTTGECACFSSSCT